MNSTPEMRVAALYYTLCMECDALDDWSDTKGEAVSKLHDHRDWHIRMASPSSGKPVIFSADFDPAVRQTPPD